MGVMAILSGAQAGRLAGSSENGWQRKRKAGAFSRLALDDDLTTVSLYHLFHDSQAQTGATGGAGAGGVGAIEAFEEVRQVFGRDAGPGILHAYFDHGFDDTGGDTDLSIAGSMHDGIA